MPTATEPPATPSPDAGPGMCILHADFHPMDSDCWGTTFEWWVDHQAIPEQQRHALYAGEVERAMLDDLVRKCRLPNVSRSL